MFSGKQDRIEMGSKMEGTQEAQEQNQDKKVTKRLQKQRKHDVQDKLVYFKAANTYCHYFAARWPGFHCSTAC